MTNEELADRWAEIRKHLGEAEMDPLCSSEYIMLRRSDYWAAKALIEALPKPKPSPTLEDQLRELVGKHKCLSRELKWFPGIITGNPWKWFDETGSDYNHITTAKALTVVRGIVKGLCDESGRGHWKPKGEANPSGDWQHHWNGETHYHRTELAAIDALLTAMQEAKGNK